MKFRKKPVIIDAIQWISPSTNRILNHISNYHTILEFVGEDNLGSAYKDGSLQIRTLEGWVIAQNEDWIIKGIKGEFYPCKPDIFEATYERVE